jgi:glycine amidinotransferase
MSSGSPVRCYTEWDPLEEAVIGVIDAAAIPAYELATQATMPPAHREIFAQHGGEPFSERLVEAAAAELDGFAATLEAAGVTVRRPERIDHSRPFSTPYWSSPGSLSAAFARDVMLVLDDEIIEAPMGFRYQYHSMDPFRPIVTDYWRRGARWTAAPRPLLTDASYNPDYAAAPGFDPDGSAVTEVEPLFEAGDMVKCGRDLVVQPSHVTNRTGIEWLRRHLGDRFRVHEVVFDDRHPMHINATFLPLRPGTVLVNPLRVKELPEPFASWDMLVAPEPAIPDDHPMFLSSKWVSMNVLSLDPETVVVEAGETELIALLESARFTVVPVPFRHVNTFGGAFHCATSDVRRRGALQDYLH